MEADTKTTQVASILRLVLFVALGHFAIDFMLSIWPVYKTMVHLDLAVAGLLAAGSIFVGELTQLYFGKLIDKGYQKQLLVLGPLLGCGAAFFPYSGSLSFYFILILFTCLGSAAFHPTAASLLGALDTPRKALFFGIFQTAGNFGMGVGQFFFAQTYDLLGGHTAILIVPVIVLTFFILFSKAPLARPQSTERISLKIIAKFFQIKTLRSLYFIQVANQTVLWSTVFLLPDFLVSRGYEHWICYGGGHLALLLGATLFCVPVSYISDKITPAKMQAICFIATLILYYAFLITPVFTPALLLAMLFVLGGLLGSMTPLSLALANEVAPNYKGMISAFLMGLVWIVSEGLGIGLSGVIADLFATDGPAKALACLGTLLVVGTYFSCSLLSQEKEQVLIS